MTELNRGEFLNMAGLSLISLILKPNDETRNSPERESALGQGIAEFRLAQGSQYTILSPRTPHGLDLIKKAFVPGETPSSIASNLTRFSLDAGSLGEIGDIIKSTTNSKNEQKSSDAQSLSRTNLVIHRIFYGNLSIFRPRTVAILASLSNPDTASEFNIINKNLPFAITIKPEEIARAKYKPDADKTPDKLSRLNNRIANSTSTLSDVRSAIIIPHQLQEQFIKRITQEGQINSQDIDNILEQYNNSGDEFWTYGASSFRHLELDSNTNKLPTDYRYFPLTPSTIDAVVEGPGQIPYALITPQNISEEYLNNIPKIYRREASQSAARSEQVWIPLRDIILQPGVAYPGEKIPEAQHTPTPMPIPEHSNHERSTIEEMILYGLGGIIAAGLLALAGWNRENDTPNKLL